MVSYAKLLAPLTGGARDAVVLATAFEAARPFAAHVVALFVRPDPTEILPFFGEGVSGAAMQEIIDAAHMAADTAAGDARAMVMAASAAAGLAFTPQAEKREAVSVSWREVQGNFAFQVALAARLCDAVVFGPLGNSEKPGLSDAFESTLIETGRPVILSAQGAAQNFAQHIAVGWDGSVASARALTAALPYLKRAERVEIFTINAAGVALPAGEVCAYLALHGINAVCRAIESGARAVGNVLLESAVASQAGLLVLGGYGHARLTQMLFGGVTRHVISHAELPLFLVH